MWQISGDVEKLSDTHDQMLAPSSEHTGGGASQFDRAPEDKKRPTRDNGLRPNGTLTAAEHRVPGRRNGGADFGCGYAALWPIARISHQCAPVCKRIAADIVGTQPQSLPREESGAVVGAINRGHVVLASAETPFLIRGGRNRGPSAGVCLPGVSVGRWRTNERLDLLARLSKVEDV
jgi:hypothetical protein